METQLIETLRTLAGILSAPTNKFGKPEFYTEEAHQARETLRLMAVKLGIDGSKTVLEQASKVAKAVIAEAERANRWPKKGGWVRA